MSAERPAIRVRDLRKTYDLPERESGLGASVRALWRRRTTAVVAVAGIGVDGTPGEVVGFLGPNGAGKTTTLKMLSGPLHPSGGEADVLGYPLAAGEGVPAPDDAGDGAAQPLALDEYTRRRGCCASPARTRRRC
jgi:ABC-type multidrug transport system ATPase subunit